MPTNVYWLIFNCLKELQSLKLNIIENSESIIQCIPLNAVVKYYFVVIVKHKRILTLIYITFLCT